MKSTCKHCQFTWTKGEDSGHSVEDCRDRLKAFKDKTMPMLENMLFWDTVPDQWKEAIRELNLTTEQGESEE